MTNKIKISKRDYKKLIKKLLTMHTLKETEHRNHISDEEYEEYVIEAYRRLGYREW